MALAIQTDAATEALTVQAISTLTAFDELQFDWERLLDRLEVPSPFLSWHWNRAWWKNFGRGRHMRVIVVRKAQEIVGIAPFYTVGWRPLAALFPFGWPDRLTEQMEPIVPGPDADRVCTALNEWLLKEHSIGLVAGVQRSHVQLFGERALHDDVYYESRELPPIWEQLLDGLSRSMRGNIRYYPRLLQRHGHEFEFRAVSDPAAVREALPILFSLHTARANAPGAELHRDRLQGPNRRRFLLDLAEELAPRGEMKIGLLRVDGEDVAAQLWFERAGTLFLHYSGYNPAWSRYSVAMITTSEIIRRGIEYGMKRVEFLRGAKQFKSRWNTEQRLQADVYFVRYPMLAPMFHRIRRIRRDLRNRKFRRRDAQLTVEPDLAPTD